MEEASGYKFHYFHCQEDPEIIFILGAWPSVDFHMQEFIPGQSNQEMLALLKDQITVEWMFHLDIDQTTIPLPVDRGFMAIVRHFIKDGDKTSFESTFRDNRSEMDSFIGGADRVVGGFRIDQGFDPSMECDKGDEFVLFTAWDSEEQHFAFAKTEGFEKYGQIRNHISGAEISHAAVLEVDESAQK